MPTFCCPLSGSFVNTKGSVIYLPPSCGQHLIIGSACKFGSVTTSWHGAVFTFLGKIKGSGASLGIDPELLGRHPFPGPGLSIRILGDITPEKVRILQEVDAVFINGLKEHGLYDKVWQAGAILLPVNSVGVMGDERTYEKVVALRAVESTDGMTADWVHLPYEFLMKISNEIINKVKGVNRVVYDISSKPPATIEWE